MQGEGKENDEVATKMKDRLLSMTISSSSESDIYLPTEL